MSQLQNIVDSLEKKVNILIAAHDQLKADHLQLLKSVDLHQAEQQSMVQELTQWKEKYEHLKVASTMLGSDQHKRDTKLKINALVRDIEHCIAQLSP